MRRPFAALTLLTALAAGCAAEVATGLDEAAADEVVLALDEVGIGAEKARDNAAGDGAFTVRVPESELVTAMAALRARGLPRERAEGMDEVLDDGSLVPSAARERARIGAATGAELARSLEAMTGVERARVHLALPDPTGRPLDDAPARARASVLLTVRGDGPDDDAVRGLVAGAVTDLAAGDVAVVRDSARAPQVREPVLARVGPVSVGRGSEGILKAILGGSFALNLILAGVLLFRRHRPATAAAGSRAGPVES